MTNAQAQALIGTEQSVTRRRVRTSSRTFWKLFALEGVIMTGLLLLGLVYLVPSRSPLSQAADSTVVRSAILARLNGEVADPLVEIQPGRAVRSSNLRGFTLNGAVYYYAIPGLQEADPLSRSQVTPDEIEIVLRDTSGPAPLIVYHIVSKKRASF